MLKEYRSVTQDEIELGQTFTKSKKITKQDVENFAVTTGDMNPAHMDDQYAQQSIFKTRIAHGMLGAGLISACLGMNLPGPGTIYLGQTLKFVHPIYFNDEITAKVEVVNLIDKKKFIMAELYTTVVNQDGDLLIEGTATVIPPKGE
ncbi:MaoC family dehydratase [Vagococcus carniphilus]|uniref:MaoC family dehydratase n=1 Tax=Vagococcus carniphilus TaxID=218144 RepID=A0AAW8U2Y3_9ENTE|nr:MaoC family dehydratase [Vagococcus carniphilus]MDT2814231.1 MaoC family dehydratase [Vagococcus carniphilus]MDT2829349.1 MaoC family dehydratase [Vagococcus carniphilus]MDT2833444.1 MaoC family dehydratase [Vagococcus carniphilus]MDT2838808.1 MaoC family dehydratase [Vagococcus carniphilus]MDT2852866.1 MaoC family dehydratase [Vagococcus carniphilus]